MLTEQSLLGETLGNTCILIKEVSRISGESLHREAASLLTCQFNFVSYPYAHIHAQYISEGFASHLTELNSNPQPKRAMHDVRSLTGEASFALPGKPKPEETSRRKPFGFSKRYQRNASTDTQNTLSTAPKQGRSTIASRQSPGPQTERNV